MKLIGTHVKSDINKLFDEINTTNGNIVQFFVNTRLHKYEYKVIKQILDEKKIQCVIHASYTINIAQNWNEYSSWIKQLIAEIDIAEYLGAFGIVIHLGKQLKLPYEIAMNNMYSSMIYIFNKTKHLNIKILFETSTGQGSEMCFKIEDFGKFFGKLLKISHNKFRICIDTCHIFQAGYDITTKNNIKNFINKINKHIGLKYIALIHLNDSKNTIGSKLDRHEDIGKGYIGTQNLLFITDFFIKLNVPIILETPSKSSLAEINK